MTNFDAQQIGATCLCLHVRRAARRMARLYDDALRPVDLSNGQFSLLTMLSGQDDWGMQDLADAVGVDRSSLTAALKPLERRNLVASEADQTDRRVRQLRLTSDGRALLAQAFPLWAKAQKRAETLLHHHPANALREQLIVLS